MNWIILKNIIHTTLDLNLINLVFDTILLTLITTAIAISIPPIMLMTLQQKYTKSIMTVIFLFFRLIPPPITAIILLLITSPGISVAALALGIQNIGILGRLLNETIESNEDSKFISLASIGASGFVSWIYGKLTPSFNTYLAYGRCNS